MATDISPVQPSPEFLAEGTPRNLEYVEEGSMNGFRSSKSENILLSRFPVLWKILK